MADHTNPDNYRLVLNLRRLNISIRSTSTYNPLKIPEAIAELSGCRYFTTLDITQAFSQIELDAKSKEYVDRRFGQSLR